MPPVHRRPHRTASALGCGLALTAALLLCACGGSSSASPTSGSGSGSGSGTAAVPTAPVLARAGDLQVAAGYVPAPASPDVAAAYFTVVDTGAADTLLRATSDASRSTTLHRTSGGAMVMLDRLPVPAGGTVALTPGADHLMLEGLTRPLARGDRVTLTLQFATAGTVTVTLPVTGYPTDGGLPTDALSPLSPSSPLPSTTAAP